HPRSPAGFRTARAAGQRGRPEEQHVGRLARKMQSVYASAPSGLPRSPGESCEPAVHFQMKLARAASVLACSTRLDPRNLVVRRQVTSMCGTHEPFNPQARHGPHVSVPPPPGPPRVRLARGAGPAVVALLARVEKPGAAEAADAVEGTAIGEPGEVLQVGRWTRLDEPARRRPSRRWSEPATVRGEIRRGGPHRNAASRPTRTFPCPGRWCPRSRPGRRRIPYRGTARYGGIGRADLVGIRLRTRSTTSR